MSKGIANLGETIRNLRLSKGLEQSELAQRTGMTQGHLSKIETGKANPSLKTLKKIIKVLDVDEKLFLSVNFTPVSLDNDNLIFKHLNKGLRKFIATEESTPFLEFAKNIHEVGLTKSELDVITMIFMGRSRNNIPDS